MRTTGILKTKKMICLYLALVLVLSALTGCGMTADEKEVDAELKKRYEACYSDLGDRTAEWEQEMKKCSAMEKRIMEYYFITTPMSELLSIDFSLLHKYASHAAMLKNTMSWAKDLDLDTFLCYVAGARAHLERVTDVREFFYDELKDIVKDRTLTEAACLVNFWCSEQATYGDTDALTESSPLGMYNGGSGRCEEESVFVVNAMRSVGIPARVCPMFWSIVPGGHAVIQVLIDGEWHYMGSCEPDPVVDSGWFTGRLGSLIKTQHIFYSDMGVGQEGNLRNGIYYVNDVGSFVETKKLTVSVLDGNGKPAEGAKTEIVLMQPEASIITVDTLYTDDTGKARYTLGKGSVGVVAYLDGEWRSAWAEADMTELTVSFKDQAEQNAWREYAIKYNEADAKQINTYTDEQKHALFGYDDFNEVRKTNHEDDFDETWSSLYPECEENLKLAGRNAKKLVTFLEKDDDPMRRELVSNLPFKYCREVNSETLEDMLKGAEAVRGTLSDEEFIYGVLLPVNEWNYFTPQRLEVQKLFTGEQMASFRKDPAELVKWFDANVNDECVRDLKGKTPELYAALKSGYCPTQYRDALLMETARAVGIPVFEDEEGNWYSIGPEGAEDVSKWSGRGGANNSAAGSIRIIAPNVEQYVGKLFAILEIDNTGIDQMYLWLDEGDSDVTIDFPAGEYILLIEDFFEEKAGTLKSLHFAVKEGQTTVITFP